MLKTMVKGIKNENGVDSEDYSIKGFDGELITKSDFRQDVLNLIGQSIGIELRFNNSMITTQYYTEMELDEYKGEFIFNNEDREIPLMALPLNSIEAIFRGYGFMDEDKWVIRLQGGLEYFIWLEM